MGLFGPDWNSRNLKKAEAAVEGMTDQAQLILVARKARYGAIQAMAVKKLTDQEVLIDIAKNSENYYVRMTAVYNEHLTDKDVIAYVGKNDEFVDVREAAGRRLKKMREAEYEKSVENRKLDVQKMKDPAALANIAKTDSSSRIRMAAMSNPNLTDQTVFAYVAVHDPDEFVRILAIRKITDANVLESLKDTYCNKGNHIWRPSTKARSNEEAMQLHFDRISAYECAICGLEETRPD